MRFRPPKWFTILTVSVLLASACIFVLIRTTPFRAWLNRRAQESLSGLVVGSVELENLEGDVLGGLTVTGFRLLTPEGDVAVKAERVTVRWSWGSLILGRPVLREARLSDWELRLGCPLVPARSRRGPGGRRAGFFAVERVVLEAGRIVWEHRGAEHLLEDVNLVLSWGRSPRRDEVNLLRVETMGELRLYRGAGSVTISDDAVVLHKLHIWSEQGELEASGTVALPSGEIGGEMVLRGLDVRGATQLVGAQSPLDGRLHAEAEVSGTVAKPVLVATGTMEPVAYRGMAFEPFSLIVKAEEGQWQVELPSLRCRGVEAWGLLGGGPDGPEMDMQFTGVDLAAAGEAWGRTLPVSELSGNLVVRWKRRLAVPGEGSFSLVLEPGILGRLRLDGASAHGTMDGREVFVELLNLRLPGATVEATGSTDGNTVNGTVRGYGSLAELPELASGAPATGWVQWEGRISGQVSSPSVEATWQGKELEAGSLALPSVVGMLNGTWPGGLSIEASVPEGCRFGPITVERAGAQAELAPRELRAASLRLDLDAHTSVAVSGGAQWSKKGVRLQLDHLRLEADGRQLQTAHPSAWFLAQRHLHVEQPFDLRMEESPIVLIAGDSAATTVRVEVRSFDSLRALLPQQLRGDGSLRAEGTFDGELTLPTAFADVTLQNVPVLADGPLASGTLALELRSGSGTLRGIASVGDDLAATVEAHLTPKDGGGLWRPQAEGRATIKNASLPLVQQLIDSFGNVGLATVFEAHAGSLSLEGHSDPHGWTGDLEVRDGIVTVRVIDGRFESVRGSALINREGMRVHDLHGMLGGGEAVMSGTIPWGEGRIGEFVLQLRGTDVSLSPVGNMWLRGNPELTYRREGGFLYLEGNVALTEGLVEGPFWEGGGGARSRARWDLALWAPGRVWIRTDNADVETALDLRLRRSGRDFALEGTVEALRGKLHYLGRHFDLVEGTLSFRGRTPPDPLLTIRSTTTVRPASPEAEETIVNFGIEGSLSDPEVVLSSDPAGYTHEQLVAMLVLDLSPEEVQDMTTVLSQELTAAMQGLLTAELARVLRREAGLDALYLESPGPGEELGEVQLLVGKYLTPELYVSVGKELLSSSLDNVRVEYLLHRARLGKRRLDVRVTGESDKDEEYGQYRYNVDLKLRYRF
jgi:hypothetical protein